MMHDAMILIARVIEYVGVAAILLGIVIAIARYAGEWRAKNAYERFRANLGRGILLGLEFLVAADIIATVTSPLSWESVGLLAAIVLIRTFLSMSLETEIEGVLPWHRRAVEKSGRDAR